MNLPRLEKAFVIGSVQIKMDSEKREKEQARRNGRNGGKGRRKPR